MIKSALCAVLLSFVSALTIQAGTLVQNFSDVSYWVGSGENQTVLIIDWQDGKNAPGQTAGEAIAWGFRWSAGQNPTGKDMLEAIAAADPRLELRLVYRSFGPIVFGLGYDLDGDGGSFTFDPMYEQGGASDPNDHFAEGWAEAGFWWYKVGKTASSSLPGWMDATEGFATRRLQNNGWEAWVFSNDIDEFDVPDPSIALAAVPEPSSAALLVCGAVFLIRRRSRP